MFFLGILGILHILFFPGLIVRSKIRFPKNLLIEISCIIATSLIVNYLVVFLLTTIGLFRTWVCIVIVIAEITCLLFLYWRSLTSINLETFFSSLWNSFIQTIHDILPAIDHSENQIFQKFANLFFSLAVFIGALVVVDWMWGFFQYNIGRIFETWDAVVSWNRWAVDWAQNMFPVSTQDYPQLIPTSWAIIYKIMGTTQVQFFSKSIMPVFPFLIILLILSVGISTKNSGFFLAIIILRYLYKRVVGEFLISGYVDLALAFFTLISVIMLWFLHNENVREKKKLFYLFAVFFSSGSAVTKQPGLLVLFLTITMGYLMVFGLPKVKIIKQDLKTHLFIILLVLIVVLPWYGVKIIEFLRGMDTSHLLYPINDTQQTHNSTNTLNLLISGLLSLGNPFYVLLLVVPSIFVIAKFWRWMGIVFVIPYSIIWAMYASYDTRNFTLLLPLIAIVVGLGAKGYFDIFLTVSRKIGIQKIPVASIPILIVMLMISLLLIYPSEKLIADQIQKQKQIFSPSINSQFYKYIELNGLKGKVLTNYPLDHLPGLDGIQVVYWYQDIDLMLEIMKKEEIGYLLFPSNSDDAVQAWIDNQITSGKIHVIFSNSDYIPYTFAEIR